MTEPDERATAFEKLAEAGLGFRTLAENIAEPFRVAAAAAAALMPAIARAAQVFQAAQAELDRTFQNARLLGAMGWTLPYNVYLEDFHRLVGAATDAQSADAAFASYYAERDGVAKRELLVDLLSRPDLADWRPLMEEVALSIEAGRYRVSVPALLAVFEGVASRWTPEFWRSKTRNGLGGREVFFRTKLSQLAANSVEFFEWSAMEAFVHALYSQAGEQKPLMLNRHWILHGKGLPDANLTDCLRLLQAIHTALEMARDELNGLGPQQPSPRPSGDEQPS
jgi:hypothetical protein